MPLFDEGEGEAQRMKMIRVAVESLLFLGLHGLSVEPTGAF